MDCSKDHVLFLADEARHYCLSHGIVIRRKAKAKGSDFATIHVPFVLFPSTFPRCLFNSAKNVQQDFNLLVHKVSQDHEFLEESLKRWEHGFNLFRNFCGLHLGACTTTMFISPHLRESMKVLDSGSRPPAFWIPKSIHRDSGLHTIVDFGFQTIVDSGFQSSGTSIPLSKIDWDARLKASAARILDSGFSYMGRFIHQTFCRHYAMSAVISINLLINQRNETNPQKVHRKGIIPAVVTHTSCWIQSNTIQKSSVERDCGNMKLFIVHTQPVLVIRLCLYLHLPAQLF